MKALGYVLIASLVTASVSFAQSSTCEHTEFSMPEGIYSLDVGPVGSPQFLQVDNVFSEDGGALKSIIVIDFKIPHMTREEVITRAQTDIQSINQTADVKKRLLSSNKSVRTRLNRGFQEICREDLVGWETLEFDAFQMDMSDGHLTLKSGDETSHYRLIVPGGSAYPVHSW